MLDFQSAKSVSCKTYALIAWIEMDHISSQGKRTMYNKELVWILQFLFLLHYTSGVSALSQAAPLQMFKGVSTSNAHTVQELGITADHSDRETITVLDETVKPTDDNALRETKDDNALFLQLDGDEENIVITTSKSEEESTRSENLGRIQLFEIN